MRLRPSGLFSRAWLALEPLGISHQARASCPNTKRIEAHSRYPEENILYVHTVSQVRRVRAASEYMVGSPGDTEVDMVNTRHPVQEARDNE
jgi:hypothetical protein